MVGYALELVAMKFGWHCCSSMLLLDWAKKALMERNLRVAEREQPQRVVLAGEGYFLRGSSDPEIFESRSLYQ